MDASLSVNALQVRYHTREGTLTALQDVSLAVYPGEIVGIVGESGCGKSTVASALMGLLPPNGRITAGQVVLNGQDLVGLDQEAMRQIRGKDMAMIFQDPMTSLNPVFTIEQQMVDAQRAHGGGQDRQQSWRDRAVAMLERVGIPDAARQIQEYPHQFSGGMRQRIMIAMALLSRPSLLIADEPTSALDVTLEAQIVELIRGLRDELGTSILYITHDLGVVAQLCDRVLVMYMGNVVEAGEVMSIFEQPRHPYTQALLASHPAHSVNAARLRTIRGRVPSLKELPPGCKFAPRCDLACAVCHASEPRPVTVGGHQVLCHAHAPGWEGDSPAAGRPAAAKGPAPAAAGSTAGQGEVLLEVRDVCTHFYDHTGLLPQVLGRKGATVRAVDGVSLQIRRGETLALVGESGSGKTTLGRTILRLQNATAGQIVVDGTDLSGLAQRQIRPLRARMQMVFQDPSSSLSPRIKVSSLLLEPFQIHGIKPEPDQVDRLLAMVGISSEQADKYAHQLSGGQARRVGIARALALHPDLLVADEPTAGLDVSVAAGILNLLKDLHDQFNLTYLIITHNLNVVSFVADRVAVMYLGKIVELAPTGELFARPRHPYTEALMSAIPVPDPRLRGRRQRILLEGEIPSPRNPPPGCPFHPRCRHAQEACSHQVPRLAPVAKAHEQHLAACHLI